MFVVILLGAIALATWRAAGRTLFWDDFLIPAKYATDGMPSLGEAFQPHDGHVMPGAIALQSAVSIIAPLQWWLPAGLIIAGTIAVTVVWWCALERRHLLAVTAIVFSPFLGAALGWWSASINALAWQLAFGVTVLIIRRHRDRLRPLTTGLAIAVAVILGLLFSELALSIIPATTVLILVFPDFWRVRGMAKKDLGMILAPGWIISIAWAGFYAWLVANAPKPTLNDGTEIAENTNLVFDSAPRALRDAIAPGLLGGPWQFERWAPGMSFASPTLGLAIAATAAAGLAVVLWAWTHRRVWRLAASGIAISASYLLLVFIALQIGRTSVGTTDLITRSLHYYADWFTVTVVAAAAVSTARRRQMTDAAMAHATNQTGRSLPAMLRRSSTAAICIGFIVSSTITTWGFLDTWKTDDTASWMHNARQSLQAAQAPLLPQPVPATIASRYADSPVDIGDIAAQLDDWPGVQKTTPKPQFLLDDGTLVPAGVFATATTGTEKKTESCGQKIPLNTPTLVELSNSLPFGEWTWELNTSATISVDIRVATPNGLESYDDAINRATYLTAPSNLTRQFVRVAGGGGQLELLATPKEGDSEPDDHLCLGSGAIGPLLPR